MCSIDHDNLSKISDDTFPSYEKMSNFKSCRRNKHEQKRSSSDWNIDTSIGSINDNIITKIPPTIQNSEMLLLSLLDMFIDVYSKENNIDKITVKERMVKLLRNYGFLQHVDDTNYSLDVYKKFLRNFLGSIFSLSPEKLLTIEYSNFNDPSTNNVVLSRYKYEFEEIDQIGKGGSGSVFKSKHCLDNTIYAIKKIILKNTSEIGYILREIQILAKLDHLNVIRYFNSWIETDVKKDHKINTLNDDSSIENTDDSEGTVSEFSSIPSIQSNTQLIQYFPSIRGLSDDHKYILYMQMQLCNYSLDTWLGERNNNKQLIESIKTDNDKLIQFTKNGINIFKQILDGIDYIHSMGIIHRDLKPSNIFLCNVSSHNNEEYIIKIGDFGLATKEFTTTKHSNGVGTIAYSSPEQIHSSQYDNRTDIFSLGLILFELLYPMRTSMEKVINFQMLRNGDFPKEAEYYINSDIKNILLKMLLKDQNDRMTLTEIIHYI